MITALLFIAALLVLLVVSLYPKEARNRLKQRWYLLNLRGLADTLGATMVAATAIVANDRPAGHHFTGTLTLDPGSIAAGGREVETAAIPGVQVGDVVIVRNRTARSLIPSAERVSAANAIEFILENNTAGAIDAGADIYDFAIIRGSTMSLR